MRVEFPITIWVNWHEQNPPNEMEYQQMLKKIHEVIGPVIAENYKKIVCARKPTLVSIETRCLTHEPEERHQTTPKS